MTNGETVAVVDEAQAPREYWTGRFRKYGHTGDARRSIYAYDQPQRLRAIDMALRATGIEITEATRVLDIGCGTADLIASFRRRGAVITGIDLSEEVARFAKARFADGPRRVHLCVMEIEAAAIRNGTFDLITSINVLQHVTRPTAFDDAVAAIAAMVKPRGHVLIMEFSPIRRPERQSAAQLAVRARSDYIEAFEVRGCRLVCEFGLPRVAVRLSRSLGRAVRGVRRLFRRGGADAVDATAPGGRESFGGDAGGLDVARAALLRVVKPLDDLLTPFPARFTDMRILIFEKRSKSGVGPTRPRRSAEGRCAS